MVDNKTKTFFMFIDEETNESHFLPTKPVPCPDCGVKATSIMQRVLERLRPYNNRDNDTGCERCGGDRFLFVVDKPACDPLLYRLYSERYPERDAAH